MLRVICGVKLIVEWKARDKEKVKDKAYQRSVKKTNLPRSFLKTRKEEGSKGQKDKGEECRAARCLKRQPQTHPICE